MFKGIFGPSPQAGAQLPFDLQTEQESIGRRRQIANILAQQALQNPGPGQMVGRHFVATSPWENIARLGQAYMSGNMQTQADADTRGLAGRYNEQLKGGLDKYFQTRQGSPGTPGVPAQEIPTEDGANFQFPGQAGMPGVRGDPRRAAVEALTSGLPALARLGQSDLESLSKNAMTAKDFLTAPGMSAASRVRASQTMDPNDLRAERRTVTLNDGIYELQEDGGSPKQVFDASEGWGPPERIPGAEGLFQRNARTAQLRRVDGGGTTVKIDNTPGFRKIPDAMAAKASEQLVEYTKSAQAAAKALSITENLKRVSVGTPGGNVPFPNAAQWFGQVANAFGVRVDTSQLANMETFQSEVAKLWVEVMAQAGGARGLTEKETDFIKNSLPSLVQTPQGRVQIIEAIEGQARLNMQAARQAGTAIGRAMAQDDPEGLTSALIDSIQAPASMQVRPPVTQQQGPRQPAGAAPGLKPGDTLPGTDYRIIRRVN